MGHIAALHHITLGIAGGCGRAQDCNGFIGFGSIKLQLTELRGSPKTQGQHASGQRIERAGMARFFGAQKPLRLLQGVIARKAERFVEQQHPMHRAPLHPGAWRVHG